MSDYDSLNFKLHDQESWSKCSNCGAKNGLYGRPLEMHTPRCDYFGPANTKENQKHWSHYLLMLNQDPGWKIYQKKQRELNLAHHLIDELKKRIQEMKNENSSE